MCIILTVCVCLFVAMYASCCYVCFCIAVHDLLNMRRGCSCLETGIRLWGWRSKEEMEAKEDMEEAGWGRRCEGWCEKGRCTLLINVECRYKWDCWLVEVILATLTCWGYYQTADWLRWFWPPSLVGDTTTFYTLVCLSHLWHSLKRTTNQTQLLITVLGQFSPFLRWKTWSFGFGHCTRKAKNMQSLFSTSPVVEGRLLSRSS